MPLALEKNISAITTNVKTRFSASGGTAPYTYSVEEGGAGGTIVSSTGIYTAPSSIGSGIDTITVVDDLGASVSLTIPIMTPIGLVCHVIQSFMGLEDGQVYLYNQKLNIPKDNGLYVAVGIVSLKPFSNTTRQESNDGLSEISSININAMLSINIMSRGTQALERKEEVLMALKSYVAQKVQEANSFYIAPLASNMVNVSGIDGTEILYHYNTSINIQYCIKKTTAIDYFDTFNDVSLETNL